MKLYLFIVFILLILFLILNNVFIQNKREGLETIIKKKQYFLGLITRCKDEFFIKEFCDYYLSQGVDKIYIIDDDSIDKTIYSNIRDKRVEIIYTTNVFKPKNEVPGRWNQMDEVNKLYKQIKQNFEWIISVDVDEFITTKKNINNTIRDELKTTFNNVDCIKIPWVMMSSNGIEKNPESILKTNVYRWNHNKQHPYPKDYRKFRCRYNEIEIKCIFKSEKFDYIDVHHPKNPYKPVKIVNSINKNYEKLNHIYNNLRENDIKNGYLLCYHYRIISKENNINKLNKAQYIKYTLEDLNNSDYAEIKDETLKKKSIL